MDLLGIGGWDWFTLGLYFAGIIAIGIYTAKRIKDTADFFIGGRRFGKAFMIFFSFSARGPVETMRSAYPPRRTPMACPGFGTSGCGCLRRAFYWVIAPVFRRMRALTTGDFFEHRFDSSTAALYTFMGIFSAHPKHRCSSEGLRGLP